MKNKFLGLISLLYSGIILYVWITDKLKNFLAPQLQIYLKVALLPLIIIGTILLISPSNKNNKFRLSDLVLLLPLIMIIIAGDGRLSTNFATNRMSSFKSSQDKVAERKKEVKEKIKEKLEEKTNNQDETEEEVISNYDFSNIDFDVVDASYIDLASYLTFSNKAVKYEGKTIRVRGFATKSEEEIPKGYFAIGKYGISCCVADASFVGFIAKYDLSKVKMDNWYEVEGILKQGKDGINNDIMYIDVKNIKKIKSKDEEEYVYPCYAYDDDGSCKESSKYDLDY